MEDALYKNTSMSWTVNILASDYVGSHLCQTSHLLRFPWHYRPETSSSMSQFRSVAKLLPLSRYVVLCLSLIACVQDNLLARVLDCASASSEVVIERLLCALFALMWES